MSWGPRRCSDPDRCPAQPAWDVARADMFEELSPKLDDAINEVPTNRITRALVAYAA